MKVVEIETPLVTRVSYLVVRPDESVLLFKVDERVSDSPDKNVE